ncbi:L-erythro-3,5-diaminohexanoate dehydrogenase [Microbacterium sp. BWT-B31]|uniref:L-erythro-3,5-diaminohexanoate dehydrogenase n=1 Tax=Microbacterium sp. BWT-B31 TaxID=3232072 RepID=UPI0035283BDE
MSADVLTRSGAGRVVAPAGALPQAADRLRPEGIATGAEVAVAVEYLNLDSASFRDLAEHNRHDPAAITGEVLSIVARHGKMTNPRTGSGGMLVGRVIELGDEASGLAVGDRIASLISLTATPLEILDALERWDASSEVVPVSARAVLPSPAALCRLPDDISPEVALSVLDVCGAPAHAERLIRRPLLSGRVERMLLLGGGKSAVLAAAAARRAGVATVCVVPGESEAARLRAAGLFDEVVMADATDPAAVHREVAAVGPLADLTLVCVNAPGCEHAALVSTRPGGAVVFFSMATSFTAVALGAEALCLDLDLFFGTGYVPGHAETALELVRTDSRARGFFEAAHRPHHTTDTEQK